jgi:hypothetical protein
VICSRGRTSSQCHYKTEPRRDSGATATAHPTIFDAGHRPMMATEMREKGAEAEIGLAATAGDPECGRGRSK